MQSDVVSLAGDGNDYALSWAGYFFFERNKPATFQRVVLQLLGRLADGLGRLHTPPASTTRSNQHR